MKSPHKKCTMWIYFTIRCLSEFPSRLQNVLSLQRAQFCLLIFPCFSNIWNSSCMYIHYLNMRRFVCMNKPARSSWQKMFYYLILLLIVIEPVSLTTDLRSVQHKIVPSDGLTLACIDEKSPQWGFHLSKHAYDLGCFQIPTLPNSSKGNHTTVGDLKILS